MAAQKTQNVDIATQRRESAFLSLSPFQSTPHTLPVTTKAVTSPASGNAPSIAHVIEPLQKVQRSSSDSSDSSASGTFLKLNAVADE